jgi:hypothetical protein
VKEWEQWEQAKEWEQREQAKEREQREQQVLADEDQFVNQ